VSIKLFEEIIKEKGNLLGPFCKIGVRTEPFIESGD
jgi:hypothetical protein